jgi:hypothetical protein
LAGVAGADGVVGLDPPEPDDGEPVPVPELEEPVPAVPLVVEADVVAEVDVAVLAFASGSGVKGLRTDP